MSPLKSAFLAVFLTGAIGLVNIALVQGKSSAALAQAKSEAEAQSVLTKTENSQPETEIDIQPYLRKKQFYKLLTLLNEKISQSNISKSQQPIAVKNKSQEASLLLKRGTCLYSYCDYRKAIADFDAALKQNPSLGEATVRRAICLSRLGKGMDARFAFIAASKQKQEGELVYLTGRGLLECGEVLTARDYLLRYLRSHSVRKTDRKSDNDYGIKKLLGLVLFASGDKDGALYQLNTALEATPNDADALLTRARVYLSRRDFESAYKDSKASAADREDANAYLIAADAALNSNDIENAKENTDKAMALYGRSIPPQALAIRAQISLRKGDLSRAAAEGLTTLSAGYIGQPMPLLLERQVIYEDKITNSFNSIEVSPHFVFYSDIAPESLHKYAEIAEAFSKYVENNMLALTGNYPRGIFILHDKMAERKFLKEKMGFDSHVHGVYLAKRNAMVTYDGAGIGTFLHELLHTFLHEEKELDLWAEEGIPAFFEACYGYFACGQSRNFENCEIELTLGYPETWEKKWMGGKERRELDLKYLVNSARHSDAGHEDEQRQVALFLCHEGKLFEFFKLLRAKQKNGFKTYIEACFEKPLDELQSHFTTYMKELENNQQRIRELPASNIFQTREEFEDFKRNLPDAFLPF